MTSPFKRNVIVAALLAAMGPLYAQHDQNIANSDGATVRADMNNALAALFSVSSGSSAPTTTIAYMLWADTTNGLLKQRNAANTSWLVRGTLAETFLTARSSNTILGVADFGRAFIATSTFSQTLTAAATLGDGWYCWYRNDGAGVITIDPNSSETIDGATTIILSPGEACGIFCTGAAFKTIGRTDINALDADGSPDTAADYVVTYDASTGRLRKVLLSNVTLTAASQAQQETGTSTAVAVTPGRQQFHPSAAKGWVKAGTTGNILLSYNVLSVTDAGVGQLGVTWDVDFSSTHYVCVGNSNGLPGGSAATTQVGMFDNSATGSITFWSLRVSDGAGSDPSASYMVAAYGDQ